MKLTIELSVQDALTVLQGLDLSEVTITTTDSVKVIEEPKNKPKRKRRTKAQMAADEAKKLEESAKKIATERVDDLDDKITETYTESVEDQPKDTVDHDTTGESFSTTKVKWN